MHKTLQILLFLVLLSTLGYAQPNTSWVRTYGSNNADQITTSQTDRHGNTYIFGYFSDIAYFGADVHTPQLREENNHFIAKINKDGNKEWLKQASYFRPKKYPFLGNITVTHSSLDSSDNFIIAGSYNAYDSIQIDGHTMVSYDPAHEFSDAFIAKFSPDGSVKWLKTFGSKGTEACTDVCSDKYGNIYVSV